MSIKICAEVAAAAAEVVRDFCKSRGEAGCSDCVFSRKNSTCIFFSATPEEWDLPGSKVGKL
jgi:hypothetical protein